MAYATSSDVQARLPGFTFSTTTAPSTTQITQWLTEADAFLNGALLAAGLTSPNVDARGLEILKSWACSYAEGHTRMALAAAGGDGSNDDGKDLVEQFMRLVSMKHEDGGIVANPGAYGQMLQGGDAPATATRLRSYVTHNTNDETIDGGDFDPVFQKRMEW